MEIYFLGTGAGTPSRERNVTSISLKLFEERGTFWLFDCGEGTQHQILNSSLKLSKLEKLFITHLHGDHIYGLPGLLTTRSNQGVTSPLTIYGPPGIREFVETALKVSQAHLDYSLEIIEIDEQILDDNKGILFKDTLFTVITARIEHRIESFGYRIIEHDKPGRLHVEKLQGKGLQPGPIYAEIKKGKDITLENGDVLKAADYMEPDQPGKIIVIMGDTRICGPSRTLSQNADVLVHEATFSGDLKDLAFQYFHTTAVEIATLAKECQVKALIMTHISSRYQGKNAEVLVDEAKKIFEHSFLAKDLWGYSID